MYILKQNKAGGWRAPKNFENKKKHVFKISIIHRSKRKQIQKKHPGPFIYLFVAKTPTRSQKAKP